MLAPAMESSGSGNTLVMRKLFVMLPLLAACGTEPDSRPVTFEAVVFEVLAPTCGQVQCHSTTTRLEGYAFDTLAAAKESLRDLVGSTVNNSELVEVLHADGEERMPPDSPLADEDIALIEAWIAAGAPGL